jgi:hypothetical protein
VFLFHSRKEYERDNVHAGPGLRKINGHLP